MDVVREFPAGHIGYTPQNTDNIIAGSRVAGELADYTSRYQPPQVARLDAILPLPDVSVAADPGYFTDANEMLRINAAVANMQPGVMRVGLDPKGFGDLPGEPE